MTEESKDAKEFQDIRSQSQRDALDALMEMGYLLEESMREYSASAEKYWENLSPDEKLMVFYAICSRIRRGDIEEGRSYRGVLYDVFGFDTSAYAIGMACGYFNIHTYIQQAVDNEPNKKAKDETE